MPTSTGIIHLGGLVRRSLFRMLAKKATASLSTCGQLTLGSKTTFGHSLAEPFFAQLSGSKYWFNIYFIHGYWQFPLHENSQGCQSFHTPFGVHTQKRVLHVAKNSGIYFQSSMEAIFGHLYLLIYIDDLLGYAKPPPSSSIISAIHSQYVKKRASSYTRRSLSLLQLKSNSVAESSTKMESNSILGNTKHSL